MGLNPGLPDHCRTLYTQDQCLARMYPNITEKKAKNINTRRKINVEIIKKMMSKMKTSLESSRNQDWKTVKVGNEKN